MKNGIENILNEREKTHGNYEDVARVSQALKDVIRLHLVKQTKHLTSIEHESLDMICGKIARILNGDSREKDHWRDIAGYSMLIVRELEK